MDKLHPILRFNSGTKNLNIVAIFFLAFCCLIFHEAKAQEAPCGAFTYEDAIMLADKNYATKKEQAEKQWILKARQGAEKSSSVGMLTIPVAVHVVHLTTDASGSGSNLSNAQVEAGIDFLNSVFQGNAINPVTNATMPIEIAFCLADVTHDASNDFSNLNVEIDDNPSQQSTSIKNSFGAIADFPRTDFMNVWVVSNICQNASNCSLDGYSTLAPAHGSWYDGIVIQASIFNGFGLAHEVGHYLNLKHTFGPFDNQADCTNDDCNTDNDCVCDTRPDGTLLSCAATNTCHTDVASGSPFMFDENDPIGNIMDYCNQWSYFTIGQRDRMRTAIEGTRSSLLGNTGSCCVSGAMNASFTFQITNMSNTEFKLNASSSQGSITSYSWYFDGVFQFTITDPITGNLMIPPGLKEICLEVSGPGLYCSDRTCQSFIGGLPSYDGCNEVCNGIFDAVNITPLSNIPFNEGQIQCWECCLGSPSFSTENVDNNPNFGSAVLVVEANGKTEAIRGFTKQLVSGKKYILSMYKANGFNSGCQTYNPTKTKVVIDVDTNQDGISDVFYPNNCGNPGLQSPLPSNSNQTLTVFEDSSFPQNQTPNFERFVGCVEIPLNSNSYKDLIIYPTSFIPPNGCSSSTRGVAVISKIELIQDQFIDGTDFTIPCPKEVELGKEAECSMTDVFYKWEKETSTGNWEVLIENQITPVFNYFVMQTTKFRLTRDFRQPNGQTVAICQGLATTDEFTVTVTGHLPDAEFSTETISDCDFSIEFYSNDIGVGITHEWTISPSNQLPPSTDANPTLNFPGPGTYLVSHTVNNDCGSRVFSKEIVLDCNPPQGCSCPSGSYYIGAPNTSSLFSDWLQSNGGPLPDNPTGPINVIIDGFLLFDETYTFPDGSNICMGPASIIFVPSYGNLTLTGTHVTGCGNMWNGFSIGGGTGKFVVEAGATRRSAIEDAIQGIRISTANVVISGTDFSGNIVDIYAIGGFTHTPIADCNFNGGGPFKPSFNGQTVLPNGKTRYAIELINSHVVSIGSNNMIGNNFNGVGTGIFAENTSVILLNSNFSNIKNTNAYGVGEGYAVYAVGQGHSFRQGVSESCSSAPSNVTISNCTNGMYFQGMHVSARKNNISGVNQGIALKNCKVKRITICDNIISAKEYGIRLLGNDNAIHVLVQGNSITMDHQNTRTPLDAAAILVTEGSGTKQLNAVIQDNTEIYSNLTEGIRLDGCNGYEVINNTVNKTNTSSGSVGYGINIVNSDNLQVRCNDMMRSNSTGLLNGAIGMSVMATRNTTYSCNTISGSGTGLVFDMDCGNSRNIATNITGYYTGLRYAPTAITGKQPNPETGRRHGNTWGTIPSNIGALGAVHGSSNQDFQRESLYTVHTNSNGFYPPPVNLPLPWFVVDSKNSDHFSCGPFSNVCPQFESEPYPDGDPVLERKVAQGQLSPGVYDEQTKWIMEYGLYQRLYDKPSLMTGDLILADFYSTKSSTPMGYLAPIKAGIRNLFVLDNATGAQVAALEETMEAKMTEIATIDEQLPIAMGTPNYAQLLAQRSLASEALNTANTDYQVLMNTIGIARSTQADNLLASNGNIVTAKVYEQNEVTVNRVFLSTIGKDLDMTATQQASLEAIAIQCPYEGGKAVLQARGLLSMLGVEAIYDDAANCQPLQQLEGNQPWVSILGQQISAKVFPNPTKERFSLVLDAPLESDAKLVLVNTLGQTVGAYSISAGLLSYEFEPSNMPEGIYFLSVKDGKKQLFSTRLVVQK